ncbi:MAG: BatA domain-containing protein, partial [Planctomycetota bacterium]
MSLFLYLLPLASLPVLFHLFYKQRKRSREISTLMFFHRVDPRLSAIRKLREILILILRTAFLILLLLALARPDWLTSSGGGSAAISIIIDNSSSMKNPSNRNQSKLEVAKKAAVSLIKEMKSGDNALVSLIINDFEYPGLKGLSNDIERLINAVNIIEVCDASGRPAEALKAVVKEFDGRNFTNKEIHIFTDLQQNEWNRKLSAALDNYKIYFHLVPTVQKESPAVSISALKEREERNLAGRKKYVDFTLRNNSKQASSAIVKFTDNTGNKSSSKVSLKPEEVRNISFPYIPEITGPSWIKAETIGEFVKSVKAFSGIIVEDQLSVYLPGKPEDYGLIPLALSPNLDASRSGILPIFIKESELQERLVSDHDSLFILPADQKILPWSKIADFVKKGVRLLVFTREGSFNKINNSALEFAGTEVLPSVKSKEKLDL